MENNVNALFMENDEILKSIRNFGIRTISAIENESPGQSIDEVMQDFALNGVIVKQVEKNNPKTKTTFNNSNMTTILNKYFLLGKTNIKNRYKFEKYANYQSCVFCQNNNEPEAVYKSHSVRDSFGKVLCPKLRTYICPICGASGDNAHTVKYCPEKRIITMEDTEKYERTRLMRTYTFNFKQEVNY